MLCFCSGGCNLNKLIAHLSLFFPNFFETDVKEIYSQTEKKYDQQLTLSKFSSEVFYDWKENHYRNKSVYLFCMYEYFCGVGIAADGEHGEFHCQCQW